MHTLFVAVTIYGHNGIDNDLTPLFLKPASGPKGK
jgi:hypothetical protein